jgi:hypothetical protein
MLNIPAEIQALYKTDSVRKNFRVHFPNGESPDLTNSDIVAGSVSFTESVCSKDVLQFGLAEASRIEFECVNVPNIYGAVIECYNEIDATDADAQYQTTMPDLDYPVYQIPLGVFTVSSCPRSAGAMWKRRVEAYAVDNKQNGVYTPFLTHKLSIAYTSEVLLQNAKLLVAQELNSFEGLTYSEDAETMPSYTNAAKTWTWTDSGDTYVLSVPSTTKHENVLSGGILNFYRFTCDFDDSELKTIYARMAELGALPAVITAVKGYLQPCLVVNTDFIPFENPEDSGIFYPYYGNNGSINLSTSKRYVDLSGVTITLTKNGSTINTYTLSNTPTNYSLTRYTLTVGVDQDVIIALKGTNNDNGSYSFTDSLDLIKLIEADAELKASFAQIGRDGKSKYVTLSKSSPISMSADEYSTLWWDEYDIAPIGAVSFSYYDVDEKQENLYVYEFGQGASVYQMNDNYILKNLGVGEDFFGVPADQMIRGMLRTTFIPNIADIAFTPVQLSSLGLPYLEAGDYLEIDDGNGGTVGTYIMSRTLSGVQFLEDDIESKGGEIIGNVRSA